MNITAFAVRRWQFTLVVFVALAALGIHALITIPKAEDPTFPFATFQIAAVLPGATPTDVERLVVDPIEAKLKALENVKTLSTEIEDGLAVIRIEFRAGSDPDKKRDEVLRETTALRPTLPAELVRLEVFQFNAAKVNIQLVALVSNHASFRDLDTQARALKKRLENRPGVGEVEIAGLPKQEVAATLDLDRMVALGVSQRVGWRRCNRRGALANSVCSGTYFAGILGSASREWRSEYSVMDAQGSRRQVGDRRRDNLDAAVHRCVVERLERHAHT